MGRAHCPATATGWEQRRRTSLAWILALVCAVSSALAPQPCASAGRGQSAQSEHERELDEQALEEFKEELDEYVELRRKLDAKVAPLPTEAEPARVHAHELALAKFIAASRARAQEGDLFVSEVRPLVLRRLREVMAGPAGRELRAKAGEEWPGKVIRPRVNGRYPDEIPLSTVPYSVLSALPPLPAELEYRFLGRDLILLDVDARIIVDILRGAIPR
jgi:hypothetical protein